MTMSQSGNETSSRVGGGSLDAAQDAQRQSSVTEERQAVFEEQQRQELEAKINELRAKCRLQAEQLMAWRKAYAIEVSTQLQ